MNWAGIIPSPNPYKERQWSQAEITVSDAKAMRKTTIGTAIGNFTEWYDFGVYSYVVSYIAMSFFPGSSLATLAAFVGLAISFLIRPIGGIFWGLIGDRIGRRGVLATTVVMMAIGTFLVGILPGYATIGWWAPIGLFVLRGVQGFSTGGEYVGAITFLSEHAPDSRRGHLTSFLPVGTVSGYILGSLLVILMQVSLSDAAMQSWGWRIPFLIALPIGFVGLYLRMGLEETPAYENQDKDEGMDNVSGWQQIKETCAGHWPAILACGGLTIAFNVTNYMLTGYVPTYLMEMVHVHETTALVTVTSVMIIVVLLVTFVGSIGDKIGRKPILWIGCLAMIVISAPMFLLTSQGSAAAIFFGTLPEGLMLVCFMATIPSTLPALFPTNARLGATSIGFNIAVSAFGGTTPLIAAALVETTGNLLMPGYILIAAGIIGAISVYYIRESAGRPMPGSGPNVTSEAEAQKLTSSG